MTIIGIMTTDNNELSYTNSDGDTVFTSTYLKNRGTCCRTNCLHCPYGHTLKNYPIEIQEIKTEQIQVANEIVTETNPVEMSALSMSLLAGAFGKKEKLKAQHVTLDNINSFAFGTFKGVICSVIEFSTKLSESHAGRPVKELFLKKEFQDQGLGIEHIR
jgi:hypothetical protein